MRREVTRVITPGTVTEDDLLDPKQNNHLAAVFPTSAAGPIGLAWLDVSTGQFLAMDTSHERLREELARLSPAECIGPEAHAHRIAETADAATPTGARLGVLDRKLHNAVRAIAGLTVTLAQASDDLAPSLRAKCETFQIRRQALESERYALTAASPERQLLLRVSAELESMRVAVGLDREEARLADLRRQHGRAASRRVAPRAQSPRPAPSTPCRTRGRWRQAARRA